jgi:hypothetical protein
MRLLLIGTTQVAASRTSKQDRKLGTEADLLPTASFKIVWFYDRHDRICTHMLLSYRQRYIV